MSSIRIDFVIEKRSRFYKQIDLITNDGVPISLVGKTVEATIKESSATETVLHSLTETNGGIEVIDDALGQIALFISGEYTDVEADIGVYDIKLIDTLTPGIDDERLMEGTITYTKGIT